MTSVTSARKRDQNNSGSPRSGEPVFLTIGKLKRTHGVKGDLVMEVLTDSTESFTVGMHVFVGPKHVPLIVSGVRATHTELLIRFEGYTDCDQAAIFRNQVVAIRSIEAPSLRKGRFYQHQVIGLSVVDENENPIGVISEIITTGANDVYVVKTDSSEEILIPAVKEFVKKIDIESKRMVVKLPDWE
jgi:16S rRNA processing protein RimM